MLHNNESTPSNNSNAPAIKPAECSAECSARIISHRQVFVDNLPYIAMILLGAAICWLAFESEFWRWLSAVLYLAYGAVGALWIIVFVCPYCHFYDTRLCPCGYGAVAPKFRSKKDGSDFARQFKKHIPAIVPLWFIPLVVAAVCLFNGFSWTILALILAFCINSYAILPLVSKRYGCASCPQKDICPWMGCGK